MMTGMESWAARATTRRMSARGMAWPVGLLGESMYTSLVLLADVGQHLLRVKAEPVLRAQGDKVIFRPPHAHVAGKLRVAGSDARDTVPRL